jgi:hypothetical protein
MQIEAIEAVGKAIGSSALAYPYLRRLGVAETIDALVTASQERMVPTGEVVEGLILNHLSSRPVPIGRISAWAQTKAVYGLAADALNNDRLGRALDEIHPHLVDLWAALLLQSAEVFGLRVDRLHSDVTRVAFEGAYDEAPGREGPGQQRGRLWSHGCEAPPLETSCRCHALEMDFSPCFWTDHTSLTRRLSRRCACVLSPRCRRSGHLARPADQPHYVVPT